MLYLGHEKSYASQPSIILVLLRKGNTNNWELKICPIKNKSLFLSIKKNRYELDCTIKKEFNFENKGFE